MRLSWTAFGTRGVPLLSRLMQPARPTIANRYFAMRIPTSRHQFQRDVPEDIQPISIAIVGRPNVGKSTLFNRLQSGTRRKKRDIDHRAIISDRAGTTRDRKDALAVLYGLLLRVIDTGGLESPKETSANTLLQSMQEQVWRAIAEAQAILFLIDAQEGITPSDLAIAKMLRDGAGNADRYRDLFKTETPRDVPIILIANKAENTFIGPYLNDCYELGVGDPVIISAKKNQGMDDLYDRLLLEVGHLQQQEEENPGTAFMPTDEEGMYMQGMEGEEMAEEAEEEEAEDDLEDEEELSGQSDSESGPPPGPSLPWLTLDMPEQKWRSLRYYAHHPADPLGALDPGLKAAVMHDDGRRIGKYWLGAKQRSLPTKEARDYVLRHRRAQEMENAMKVAIIGQPNGGKSSIINALLQEERCVVDEADGTTMDSIITNWTFKEHPVKLIDTCGIYRGWQYSGTTAEFVQPGMGTRKAIRRAHVCVLCLDAQRYAKMTHNSCPNKFEINLGNFVADEGKCLIIAINKWDLIHENDQPKYREEILKRIAECFSSIKGVPVVFLSAKYNLNLPMLMTRSLALYKRWCARLPTSRLNSWLQAWMLRWPPPWRNGQKCSIKYMTQTRARPPTFVLWTNSAYGEFPKNYIRQMQNAMRDEFRISGVPLSFNIRSTLMPKPRKKLSKKDILKWKRMGPKQAKVAENLNSKKMPRPLRQID